MSARERSVEHGVRFLIGEHELERRSKNVRAVIFDWDGVFNDGFKDAQGGSPFSEVDSMGVNLLRFALWSSAEERLPVAAVITGQHNALAKGYAEREHFHGVYMGFTNKTEAFDAFLREHDLKEEEVLFFFDDVLDLPVAARCGLRVLIGHRATHHLQRLVSSRGIADVVVPLGGGHHGLRQACEVLMSSWGAFERVVDHRVAYDTVYQRYLDTRNAIGTRVVSNPR